MDKNVISREYTSVTKCDRMDDGFWKAYTETKDAVLYEGETEWVVEIVDAMAMDSNPQKAIETAMNSVFNYIMQNVYQNGFKSLVDYREFQRSLESKKAEAKGGIEINGS
jgi:hypothetical protein